MAKKGKKRSVRRKRPKTIARPGLHTRLDEDLIRQFCKLARRGLPADGVCDYLGIQTGRFHDWLRKGETWINGDGEPEEYELFGIFVVAFKKALASYRLRTHVKMEGLADMGKASWTCYMTQLERRDRHNYAKNEVGGGSLEDVDPDERFL